MRYLFGDTIKEESEARTCSVVFRSKTGVTLEANHYLRLSKVQLSSFPVESSIVKKKSLKMSGGEVSNKIH